MLNKQSRAAALTIALDPEVPSATRCSLLADFKRVPPSSEELRALLVPQRIIDEKNQRVRSEILTTILGTPDPELQKQIVNGLKELLLQPPVAADLKSALSAIQGVRTPAAVERLKFLADNPSILASDINRDLLVKTRAREIRSLLRELPLVRECVAMIAQDPTAGRLLRAVLSRRNEFVYTESGDLKSPEPGFEATRFITPIFSALSRTPLGRDLLGVAIERINQTYSEQLWAKIKARDGFVLPEIVLGSGPSSVNYRSTRLMIDPDYQGVVIDSAPFGGGQFASSFEPMFRLNSRSRPLGTVARKNLPGTESPLNTLGPYCAVQESDLGSEVYGTQVNLGLAIQLNHLLAGGVLCGVELTRWNRISAAKESPRYVVELRNILTGETARVETARIVSARGLGQSRISVDQKDPTTAKILREQQELFAKGDRPQFLTFPQFYALLGDRLTSDPLQRIRTAIVIGAGDGGNVVVESLLGYGPATGIAPQELDCVKSVVWLGQDSKTKEDFERCARNRYVQLANDFPRKKSPSADYRIEPLSAKASRLKRSPDGSVQVVDDKGIERTADIIIDCSGFTLPEISELRDPSLSVSGSTPTKRLRASPKSQDEKESTISLTPQEAKLLKGVATRLKRAKARGNFGKLARIVGEMSLDAAKAALDGWRIETCSFSQLDKVRASTWLLALSDGRILVRSIEGRLTCFRPNSFDDGSEWGFASSGSITRQVGRPTIEALNAKRALLLVPPNGRFRGPANDAPGSRSTKSEPLPSNYRKVSSTINGQEVQIASQVNGEDVFIIGPESRISFSLKEREQLQLNFIAENVVAVFLYSSRITAFAEELGGKQNGNLRNPALPTAKGLKTPGASGNRSASGRLSVCQGEDVNQRPRSRVIGLDTDCEKVVELFLRDAFRGMNVPPDSAPLSVTLRRTVNAGMESIELSSSIPPRYKLEPSESLKNACKLLMTSPIFGSRAVEASVTYEIPPRKTSDRVVAEKVPLDWARMQRVQVSSSVPRPATPSRSPAKPKARESSSTPGKRRDK